MKILMVATNYDAPVGGGGQKSLKILAESLLAAGHSVSVAALAHDTPGVRNIGGTKVHYLPVRNLYRPVDTRKPRAITRLAWHCLDIFNPLAANDFYAVCREVKPDIVHSHVITGLSVSVWSAAKALGLPVVHTLRDQYLLCPRSTMFKNGRTCARQCRDCRGLRFRHPALTRSLGGVIGVSRFILDNHVGAGYFEDVPVKEVVYNARTRRSLGLEVEALKAPTPRTRIRFGFIGSLAASKGIEVLLKSFPPIASTGAELWVAGTGDKAYERRLKEEYVSSSIKFLGRTKPRDFYPHVDVVIVPSIWDEPLGMVAAEALAFGKPVIGSHRGGIPEMIRHGENGWLFDPDRPEELVAAMKSLAEGSELLGRMAAAAPKSIVPLLDTARYVREHVAVYKRVIRAHSEHTKTQRL